MKSKIVKMQCRGLFLMKVRCFIVCQDYILFSNGFFIPKKSTILKSSISKVIYILLQAFTTAENLFKM